MEDFGCFFARPGHFRIKFKNGWEVSVLFRPNSYSDNYNCSKLFANEYFSRTAEVMVIKPENCAVKSVKEMLMASFVTGYVDEHWAGDSILADVDPEHLVDLLHNILTFPGASSQEKQST